MNTRDRVVDLRHCDRQVAHEERDEDHEDHLQQPSILGRHLARVNSRGGCVVSYRRMLSSGTRVVVPVLSPSCVTDTPLN